MMLSLGTIVSNENSLKDEKNDQIENKMIL